MFIFFQKKMKCCILPLSKLFIFYSFLIGKLIINQNVRYICVFCNLICVCFPTTFYLCFLCLFQQSLIYPNTISIFCSMLVSLGLLITCWLVVMLHLFLLFLHIFVFYFLLFIHLYCCAYTN